MKAYLPVFKSDNPNKRGESMLITITIITTIIIITIGIIDDDQDDDDNA